MPPGYDPETRARLLAELVARRAAGESFEAICAAPDWPSRPTLRKWLARAPHIVPAALRRPPVRWSPALADEICERFRVQSLREICRDEAMPDRASLSQWRRDHPAFAARLDAIRRQARQPRTGRRTLWTDDLAEAVSDAVFEAGTIAAACRHDGMPCPRTVRDWTRTHPDFALWIEIAMWMAYEHKMEPLFSAVRAWIDDPNADPKTAPLRGKL